MRSGALYVSISSADLTIPAEGKSKGMRQVAAAVIDQDGVKFSRTDRPGVWVEVIHALIAEIRAQAVHREQGREVLLPAVAARKSWSRKRKEYPLATLEQVAGSYPRGDGTCKRGDHEWEEGNVLATPRGLRCRECSDAERARDREYMRAYQRQKTVERRRGRRGEAPLGVAGGQGTT